MAETTKKAEELCDHCLGELGWKYYSNVPEKGNLCLKCWEQWYKAKSLIGDYAALDDPIYHWEKTRTEAEQARISDPSPVTLKEAGKRIPDTTEQMREALGHILTEVDRLDCAGCYEKDDGGECEEYFATKSGDHGIGWDPVDEYCPRCAIVHWAKKGLANE